MGRTGEFWDVRPQGVEVGVVGAKAGVFLWAGRCYSGERLVETGGGWRGGG